jgi:hypothetical protein
MGRAVMNEAAYPNKNCDRAGSKSLGKTMVPIGPMGRNGLVFVRAHNGEHACGLCLLVLVVAVVAFWPERWTPVFSRVHKPR